VQRLRRVRTEVDSGAYLAERGRRFVDVGVHPERLERTRGTEAGESASNNRDRPVSSHDAS
jgi:hypothetical protein